MNSNHDNTSPGPEHLIPGRFYHHAGMRGVLYMAIAEYWYDPASEQRGPRPGSEAMIAVNGALPGAMVAIPGENGTEEFWAGFYPAPRFKASELIIEGIRSAEGQIKVIEVETADKAIRAVANTAIGTLQRVEKTIEQIGHVEYPDAIPQEVAAKEATLQLYVEHLNRIAQGLASIQATGEALCRHLVRGTNTFSNVAWIANEASRLIALSPFNPR